MDTSLVVLLVRVVVSLGVVLAVMAGAAAVLRRSGLAGTAGAGRRGPGRPRPVQIVSRHGLSRGASITVVRLGERGLVLGVTDHQVTLLTEIDPAELEAPPDESPMTAGPPAPRIGAGSIPWKVTLEQLRDRTVRRS
ncbi:MAG TPA: flagellar biosynthetic protein FliO [Acidimicrobiia bacterium]|jgi:flagellar protein FliO/FliZ